MKKFYDFIVIGAGISGCTFASSLNKRFTNDSILLIEHGRRVGGRATTRQSRKNKILEFDHGLPSISLSQNVSQDILSLISPLIDLNKLIDISGDILIMDEFGFLKNYPNEDKVYRSLPFMINFCEEIVNQSINPKKINFLFKTLTKSINRKKDLWEVEVNKSRLIKSKNLILSSSLIAHPRCLEILRTNSLPLREAFIPGQDKIVDSVLMKTKKLTYIKRRIYIFHATNLAIVYKFNHKYLQIVFSKVIKQNLNFEKVIFQIQSNGSMVIALHCSYENDLEELKTDSIIKSFISLFTNYQIYIDLISEARLVDTMNWRASQALNHLLPTKLQWSATSNIGFCGDWFNWKNCNGVESAMNNSIRLAKLLN